MPLTGSFMDNTIIAYHAGKLNVSAGSLQIRDHFFTAYFMHRFWYMLYSRIISENRSIYLWEEH